MMLALPDALAGAILLRPMLPFEPESPPALKGIPVLISAGRNDPVVPPAQAERLAEVLARQGAAVTTIWQDTRHSLSPHELEEVSAWWRRTFDSEGGIGRG
jgi:predicted esterase